MSHVASASLPVALGLLVLTAAARAVMWADVDDARLARVARDHLGPLSTWCLIFAALHAVALGAAGELGAGNGGVALIVAAAAVLLRTETGAAAEEPDDAPEWARAAREPVAAPTGAAPARSLWAERDGEDAPRTGLWT
jgi:hypothetical protein